MDIWLKTVCLFSDESFVVMDYATLENVEVEVVEDPESRTSPPAKNSHYLSFRLLMSKNSEGRAEQISLVAESRYCCSLLPSAISCTLISISLKWEMICERTSLKYYKVILGTIASGGRDISMISLILVQTLMQLQSCLYQILMAMFNLASRRTWSVWYI